MDKMKEGRQTSKILQGGTIGSLAVNMLLPSREGKNDPKANKLSAELLILTQTHGAGLIPTGFKE